MDGLAASIQTSRPAPQLRDRFLKLPNSGSHRVLVLPEQLQTALKRPQALLPQALAYLSKF